MEQAGVQLIAAGGDVYISTINQATKATDSFVNSTDKGSGKVSAAGQVMTGALRKVGEMAVDAFAEAAKATASFLKDSVDVAGDFEAGMLEFQAVAGRDVDTKGLDKFHDLFIQLGKELPVSTSEVEQAAIEMVKGGIDPAIVAAGGLRQNIQFAAAAMDGDLVAAAEVSAKILGGWADANATAQQKAEFLTHATDQLTKAANASSVDVHELSLGIFNAQGIAKTAGVSFDDLTTTLAALSPRFASSSEAGNSLKNVIARLQPTTKPAIAAMEGLGLITADGANKFYDAQGSFIGFEQASQLLQDSLKGLTDQQKQAVLQTIFGNDAMNAASGLAELGAAGYQHMADALAGANGVAENAALKQQGFNTALENAKGSVEALQITIGSALLPILTDLLNNVVAPAVNTFTDFADALFGSDEAFNRLSPDLQIASTVIGALITDVQDIVGAFNEAGAGSSEFGESIGLLADHLGLPGDLIEDIIFGIQGLVKWFNQAGDESGTLDQVLVDLSDTFDNVLYTIEDVAVGYQHIAEAVLPIVAQLWEDHGKDITAFLKETYDSVIEIVNLALEVYDSIVPPILNAIAGFFEAHGSEIEKILTGAGEAIGAIVTGTMETIKGVFHLALDLIHGDWDAVWTDILNIGKAQVTAIEGTVKGFLDMIAGLFDTSLDGILQTWEDNWNMAVDIVSRIDWAQVGADVVSGILSGLRDNWDSLMGWVADKAHDLVQTALDAIGAGSPAKEFMPVGQFAVQGIMQGLSDAWPNLTAQLGGLSDDLVNQMAGLGSDVQSVIADSFSATASIDRQVAKNLEKVGKIGDSFREQFLSYQLRDQQKIAEGFADPATGAAYFKKASENIFELEDLRNKLNAAQDEKERERIQQQIKLIESAQGAELAAFNASAATKSDPVKEITDQLNQFLIGTGLGIFDNPAIAQLYSLLDQLRNVPARAGGGPVDAHQPYWVGEHGPELFWPTMDGMVSPAASSQQMAARANTTNYNGQVGNTYNMPVYTNNTPGAIQQSWAIMQASMP